MDYVGDDKDHDENDYSAVKGRDRPSPTMVGKPETPYPPHVEDKGDQTDRQPDRRTGPCCGPEHWRQDRQDDITEEATDSRDQDRSAEEPVSRGVVGRWRAVGDAQQPAHGEISWTGSAFGTVAAGDDRGLAHRFEVRTCTTASPAAPLQAR